MLRATKTWDVRCPKELKQMFRAPRRGYWFKVDRATARTVVRILAKAYGVRPPSVTDFGPDAGCNGQYGGGKIYMYARGHLKTVFHEFYHHLDEATGGRYDSDDDKQHAWNFADLMFNELRTEEENAMTSAINALNSTHPLERALTEAFTAPRSPEEEAPVKTFTKKEKKAIERAAKKAGTAPKAKTEAKPAPVAKVFKSAHDAIEAAKKAGLTKETMRVKKGSKGWAFRAVPAPKKAAAPAPKEKAPKARKSLSGAVKGHPVGGKRDAFYSLSLKLTGTSPHRPGTFAQKQWDFAATCRTVGDYSDGNGDMGYLRFWILKELAVTK